MTASKVRSDKEIKEWLISFGFAPTRHKTKTGKIWKCKNTGKHIQIPDSIQGFRPDWQIHEIEEIIKRFDPDRFKTRH